MNREWLNELDEVIIALPEADSPQAREIGAILQGSRPRVSFVSTWPGLRPLAV